MKLTLRQIPRSVPGIAAASGVTLLLAAGLRIFVVGAYCVPTSSMETALLPGDYLLVDKLGYRISSAPSTPWTSALAAGGPGHVRRGDIVVFSMEGIHEQTGRPVPSVLVKRVTGLPGDIVELRGNRVLIDGKEFMLPPRSDTAALSDDDSAGAVRFRVPRKGDVVRRDQIDVRQWRSFLAQEGRRSAGAEGDARELLLQQDYYFMLGDNLELSSDSRMWGPVADDRIIGRALMVYWSIDNGQHTELPWHARVRWSRIGTLVW